MAVGWLVVYAGSPQACDQGATLPQSTWTTVLRWSRLAAVPRRLTQTERRHVERTNRLGLDDDRTEGNVLQTRCDQHEIIIANRDGEVTLRLHDDARSACASVDIGTYLEAEGVKETEQLFETYEISVASVRSAR
jgi:hypothetical protein